MRAERRALDERGCWDIARIPSGVTLIRSRYVYKLKKDWIGKVVKWKLRLIIGCNQIVGQDYGETFAPVAKATTFRLMVALAKVLKLHFQQLDVDSAFLYADLDEDIWSQTTTDMDIQNGYSLKQAPRNWFHHIR